MRVQTCDFEALDANPLRVLENDYAGDAFLAFDLRRPCSGSELDDARIPCRTSDELPIDKEPILHGRITSRFGKAEVTEGVRREHPPTRGPLHEAFLDQIGLDYVLNGVARLRQCRRHGLDADRAAPERG